MSRRGQSKPPLVRGEFVRSSVASTCFHERQRAPIPHEVRRGKRIGGAEPLLHEPPKPTSRHLTFGARKSLDGTIGMGIRRRIHGPLQAKERPHRGHFTKWHSRLRHTPWTRVHAQKQNASFASSKPCEIRLVGLTSMIKGSRDVGDRQGKPEISGVRSNFCGAGQDLLSDGEKWGISVDKEHKQEKRAEAHLSRDGTAGPLVF